MRSADRWRPGPNVRRAALVIGAAFLFVIFARGARAEVIYEREPVVLTDDLKQLIAKSSTGTACGDWPQTIGPSVAPVPPTEGAAIWADAGAFHVTSNRFFVRSIRVDVRDGTAQTEGIPPQAALTFPITAGASVAFTISCEATGASIHFLGADGSEFTDIQTVVGAGSPVTAPVDIPKGRFFLARTPCSQIREAQTVLTEAKTSESRSAAIQRLIDVGTTFTTSQKLSHKEIKDLEAALVLGKVWAAELKRGASPTLSPITPEDIETLERLEKVFARVCD